MSDAGIIRFGDRIERGPAASFRCARYGEVAGVVRVARAETTVKMGPALGNETSLFRLRRRQARFPFRGPSGAC